MADNNKLEKHGVKLFVFGDSYADTGNSRKHTAVSWKPPYGITFPGKPAGSFVSGHKISGGVQRDKGGREMEISIAGNDYGAYLAKGTNNINNMEGLANLTTSIIDQLVANVRRIQKLGVRKIAVTALEPLGCLPPFTASSSFQNCSQIFNSVSDFHNQILHQKLQALNNQTSSLSNSLPVLVLDLYTTFMSAFENLKKNITTTTTAGNLRVESPLVMKPCCVGISKEYSCGSLDENGAKKYSVCKNPELSFFWDMIHPSQNVIHHNVEVGFGQFSWANNMEDWKSWSVQPWKGLVASILNTTAAAII
uniref:GDSL esterase/lipase n=1 Tax=Cannabis sativa TaxID=3483 RepID=A0A803NWV7_CANSA